MQLRQQHTPVLTNMLVSVTIQVVMNKIVEFKALIR